MKKYQRILSIAGGISLLILLVVGTTTALLTDKEQSEHMFSVSAETVDIELSVTGLSGNVTTVSSNTPFEIEPMITNAGTGSVLVFLEMDVPMVGDIPLFTYTPDESTWEFVSTATEDGYQKAIYSYGSMTVLGAGEDTADHPLIETATFGNIRTDTDLECTLIIKAYAVTDMGFDGDPGDLEPADVWEVTLEAAGE